MDGLGNIDGNQAVRALEQGSLAELRAAQKHDSADAGIVVEKLFASMLVKELRRGLDKGFFQGPGAQIYTAWLDEHLGQSLADRDALGLAGLVKTHVDRAAAREAETQHQEEQQA